MANIALKQLTKRFGDVTVVDSVSLTVADGEFLVLLGPSGCGKSTILRLIAGLEDATSGEIHINDEIVNFKSPSERNAAMVFQNYALYPHRTVRKNISFPLETAKMDKAEIHRLIEEAARILELGPLLDRLPAQLSGGQRQRVALARAIVRKPGVFLMDEPLSNLDAQLRQQTRLELMSLHERLGITTVYVTHDQVEAMTMGHRIAVMHDGIMQQLGRPSDIYDTPGNTFVARFLGAPPMNLLTGVLNEVDGSWWFDSTAGRLPLYPTKMGLSNEHLEPLRSQAVRLGVRPEHVELNLDHDGTGLTGRVHFLEPTGADLYATVDSGEEMLIIRCPTRQVLANGDVVELVFPPEAVHIFGPDSTNLRMVS
jgi:multiple sugar transport system ATP-binding protein